MVRFFTLSAFALLSLAATQCVAAEQSFNFCEAKSCDAQCRKMYAMMKANVYGQCDGNTCHCYKRNPCNDAMCENLCRERFSQENNLHSNCTESQCFCSWDKRCQEAECARACEERYPDVDMVETLCSDILCICKWQEKSAKRRSREETKAPQGGANEAVEQLRGHHVFNLDKAGGRRVLNPDKDEQVVREEKQRKA